MTFQTQSGVFDAPVQSRPAVQTGPELDTKPMIPRKLPALPCAPADLICAGLLIAEALLLFVYADAIFYHVILPVLSLLMDLSGLAIFLIVIVVAVSGGSRRFFRRHRGKGWF